jgi:cytoskeletal protein CcmA (bactofilin family)
LTCLAQKSKFPLANLFLWGSLLIPNKAVIIIFFGGLLMFRGLLGGRPNKPIPKQNPTSSSHTVLGANTHFEGTLMSKNNVRLEGTFNGNITAGGGVRIGETATLEGDLVGQQVVVAGVVRGDITASKISVLRTGRVWGDLHLESLMTEEGGFIQGIITMEESLDLPGAIQVNTTDLKVSELNADFVEVPEINQEKVQGTAPAQPKTSPLDELTRLTSRPPLRK